MPRMFHSHRLMVIFPRLYGSQPLFEKFSQHSTQVQIRFFITVPQQTARAAPLRLDFGRSVQSQMEVKLAGMNLKFDMLTLLSARTVDTKVTNLQSLSFDPGSFLSSDSTNMSATQATPPRPSHISMEYTRSLARPQRQQQSG